MKVSYNIPENLICNKFSLCHSTICNYCFVIPGKQLTRKARSDTSNIAKADIHVEHAIERLKNFKILEGNIPLSTVGVADHIVTVCTSLCYLLPALAK